jgi:hypothetical protein
MRQMKDGGPERKSAGVLSAKASGDALVLHVAAVLGEDPTSGVRTREPPDGLHDGPSALSRDAPGAATGTEALDNAALQVGSDVPPGSHISADPAGRHHRAESS